ncbi:4Fe-4S dicluster domain-containing protein [Citricoccus sp. SGAir0253]|uniref:4Fe-4S dicluster domain-containing protein n=1 Tax=Citricoccus sp. SGAir0253 TaxID=2567881 RepID=UPI0010CCC41F|nr:4Fe-4S dicluster domain-containing protein [Citricoccus sp. SGAir0253]QCU77646.1 4Fe-4S dicluster domain-containing protein [Citricoccus sp. SGAir0253]
MSRLTAPDSAAVGENPTADAHYEHPHPRKGFFTDTSICIGCKACEVACKEWNRNPVDSDYALSNSSFDNSEGLGADTWRHVAFIEQDRSRIEAARESGRALVSLGMPGFRPVGAAHPDVPSAAGDATAAALSGALHGALAEAAGGPAAGLPPAPDLGELDVLSALGGGPTRPEDAGAVDTTPPDTPEFRWLMSSDVCKHCTNAGCLDVCPTGALFRTEHGTVVVQDDVCNGCGTCVAGCPFGVIERRKDGIAQPRTERSAAPGTPTAPGTPEPTRNAGVAQKCTLCYDRLRDDQTPACAQACPTTSIRYGERADLVASARDRVARLHAQGRTEARLYGANPNDGVGGTGSVFLLLDEPEVYGLPPDPRVPTADLPRMYARAGIAMAGMAAASALAFVLGGRR